MKYKMLIVVALWLVSACSNPVEHLPQFPTGTAKLPEKIPVVKKDGAFYRLVPYDQISIRFPHHPEQDPKMAIPVQPDGNINLDAVGTIRAAGLTPEELEKLIVNKTSDRLRAPQVIVTIVQYAPRRVFVGGEVVQPGPVLIQDGMTPLQAIFERGGFRDTAQKDSVVLIRDAGAENPQIGRIDLFKSLENGTPEVITLLTNDVIYVPMSGIARVNTWVRQHLREILPIELIGTAGMAGS
jgi:polysaccharide export outer membrane protein